MRSLQIVVVGPGAGWPRFLIFGAPATNGCPILSRFVRKGGRHEPQHHFYKNNNRVRYPHPCQERKDGAPSLVICSGRKNKGGHPSLSCMKSDFLAPACPQIIRKKVVQVRERAGRTPRYGHLRRKGVHRRHEPKLFADSLAPRAA